MFSHYRNRFVAQYITYLKALCMYSSKRCILLQTNSYNLQNLLLQNSLKVIMFSHICKLVAFYLTVSTKKCKAIIRVLSSYVPFQVQFDYYHISCVYEKCRYSLTIVIFHVCRKSDIPRI